MINGKINFLSYKNKISSNNHKISSINFPELKTNNELKRSKSNLENKINFPINKSLLIEENNKKEIRNKYMPKYHKIKAKTLRKKYVVNYFNKNTPNKKESEFSDFSSQNNKINKKFYYNLICLGHKMKNEKINEVNSTSIKYFLYNISLRNKKQKMNISPLYHNYNSYRSPKKINNLKSIQPNFSLIEKTLEEKYNNLNLNKKHDLPKILSHNFSPINLKNKRENQLNTDEDSDENSSFENNQFKSSIEEKILKKEEIINEIKKINNFIINASNSKGINNLKTQKNEFLRIKNKANYKINYDNNYNIYNTNKESNKKLNFAFKNFYKYLK